MPRKKKDWKALNIKLDATLYDRFDSYCNALGLTKTEALERILKEEMDNYDADHDERNIIAIVRN